MKESEFFLFLSARICPFICGQMSFSEGFSARAENGVGQEHRGQGGGVSRGLDPLTR